MNSKLRTFTNYEIILVIVGENFEYNMDIVTITTTSTYYSVQNKHFRCNNNKISFKPLIVVGAIKLFY